MTYIYLGSKKIKLFEKTWRNILKPTLEQLDSSMFLFYIYILYMNDKSNGRVNILGENKPYQFTLFENPGNPTTPYTNAMTGNWKDSILSKAFFSRDNITIVQNGIRAGVFRCSNGRYNVAPQDEINLKIVMRSIFLQNAKNDTSNITGQIQALNNMVLQYCVKNVFGEATAYIKYRNDVSTLAVPEARPVYVNCKGDKQLELKHWF